MRLAVFSDIHGNLLALEAVLADLEASGGADLTWCLGDLAAMGPRPAECVRRIRALAETEEVEEKEGKQEKKIVESKTFKVIGGNTERYLVNGERHREASAKDEDQFAQLVTKWRTRDEVLNWNLAQLSWSDYEFLKKIRRRELYHEVEGYGWVIGFHAIPGSDDVFLWPDTPDEEIADALLDREGRLAVGGHTHKQMDRTVNGWRFVNVGSVGWSFDGHGQAQYGLFTFENGELTVDLRNIPYDLDALRADCKAAGYPATDYFINRMFAPQSSPSQTKEKEVEDAETR